MGVKSARRTGLYPAWYVFVIFGLYIGVESLELSSVPFSNLDPKLKP